MADSRVADELAIRALVARYAEGVTTYDEELWAGTWAREGEWQVLGRAPRGREALLAVWHELMGGFDFVVQQATSGWVTLDGDVAECRFQILELGRRKDGASLLNAGLYRDRCVREDGAWRFARRTFTPRYVGPVDMSGPSFPPPG